MQVKKKKSLAEHKTRHNWMGENRLWKQLKMKKKENKQNTLSSPWVDWGSLTALDMYSAEKTEDQRQISDALSTRNETLLAVC